MARKRITAEEMARKQKAISISEFFSKNRHLLGFDNPTKAVLTTVKEAMDNALDACEEAGVLPDITVTIRENGKAVTRADLNVKRGKKGAAKPKSSNGPAHYLVIVEDNGPGIVKKQVKSIFGKLLYGSKFHRLRQSRGQQGIGISAAGMYGVMTTGRPMKISTKTGKRKPTYYCELKLDTKTNEPVIISECELPRVSGDEPGDPAKRDILSDHGTRVTIELLGDYRKGRTGVDEYIRQTAISNPHAKITFNAPDASFVYARVVDELPPEPKEIKPHPYGIELGQLGTMLAATSEGTLSQFLRSEFSQVSATIANQIVVEANKNIAGKDITTRSRPSLIAKSQDKLRALFKAIQTVRIRRPRVDVLVPIGSDAIIAGLKKEIRADFYTAVTRPPTVYRGNPFLVEVGIAFGGDLSKPDPNAVDLNSIDDADDLSHDVGDDRSGPARILRYANRVPLQYKQSDCAITKVITQTNWRNYGLSQKRGQLPYGPMEIMVHIASVWVPFTSESKEAVADYDAIHKELKRCIGECARKLGTYVRKRAAQQREAQRRKIFELYIEEVVQAVKRIKGDDFDPDPLRDGLVAIALQKTGADIQEDGETEPEPTGPNPPSDGLDAVAASDEDDEADEAGGVEADIEIGVQPDDAEPATLFDGLEDKTSRQPARASGGKRSSRRRKRAAG